MSELVLLPKALLAPSYLGKGDVLYANKLAGSIDLSPHDPKSARRLEVAERDVGSRLKPMPQRKPLGKVY